MVHTNISINTYNDLTNFFKNNFFKKIFILSGKKSFKLSKAEKIFKKLLIDKNVKYYFKVKPYPEISELKKIIFNLRKFSPDLIIAIGGGSVLDYAKIANVLNRLKHHHSYQKRTLFVGISIHLKMNHDQTE